MKYFLNALVLSALLVTIVTVRCSATAYSVRPDGSGDFPTIQEAIDAADHGDLIELGDGSFIGDGNRDLEFRGKAITLQSESGDPSLCIIDCQASAGNPHRALFVHEGESTTTVIDGIMMKNGYSPTFAGGILCQGASITLRNCIVKRNTAATAFGGGIALASSSSILTDCEVRGNTTLAGVGGGGIGLSNANVTVRDCDIFDNQASDSGGGIYVPGNAFLTVENCLIRDNEADLGGGLYSNGEVSVVGSEFRGNEASSGGGGIYVSGDVAELTDCLLVGNVAHANGRGGGASIISIVTTSMTGCTVAGNRAWRGGGIYESTTVPSWTPVLERTIVSGNCADEGVGGDLYISDEVTLVCSAVEPSQVSGATGFVVDYVGDQVFTDPEFCGPEVCENAPTTGGDHTLFTTSPCLPENSPCGELIGARGEGCALGACCLSDKTCLQEIEETCHKLGGIYLGDGTNCDPNPCDSSGMADEDGSPLAALSVAPNPTTGAIRFAVTVVRDGKVTIELVDSSGRRVWQQEEGVFAGRNAWVLTEVARGVQPAPGVYFLNVRTAEWLESSKVVILR